MKFETTLGDPGVVVDEGDMLGDIGDGDSSRRRQRPFDRVDAGPAGSDGVGSVVNASHQQNMFSFITGWITSVSIVKGTHHRHIMITALT